MALPDKLYVREVDNANPEDRYLETYEEANDVHYYERYAVYQLTDQSIEKQSRTRTFFTPKKEE